MNGDFSEVIIPKYVEQSLDLTSAIIEELSKK